ncbi:hypothetical protein [Pinisolibacter aquiterrae]|uniref:hypothetical protein n=1 Tax=Pinisolibacter aquiterrae TaxID=2815579 RepID=UPI001C3E6929|nr:hypothetical protein [Pinisolibacter aquiterrae]MBV5265408.1 hypothetical protein [Pinisolibacter aquiterrae]MCC8235216.1 hypothetical protein [Pinisolibacter aquiterrae]
MELATAVEVWITERRAEAVRNEFAATSIDDETCFSRLQRERDREEFRRAMAAAEEITATFRSLSAGYTSLDSGILRRIATEFANIVRSKYQYNISIIST